MSAVQVGDVLAVLHEIYKAYDAYRTIPDKLRHALTKFKDAEDEVSTLNKILAGSRRPEHRSYPGTAQLFDDLQTARNYFKRFEPLTDESGKVRMTSRVKKTFSAKWNWDAVDAHVETMNAHRERIKDFKHTVLIQAALDNTELQISSIKLQLNCGHPSFRGPEPLRLALDNASTSSSDRMSVLTRASKSLKIARRLESNPTTQLQQGLSPVIEASSASTQSTGLTGDLKEEIADYVERNELYRPEALQLDRQQELEYIGRLPGRWMRSQQRALEKAQQEPIPIESTSDIVSDVSPVASRYRADLNFSSAAEFQRVVDDTGSISLSWKGAFDNVQLNGGQRSLRSLDEIPLPDPALDLDDVSDSDSGTTDDTNPADDHFALPESIMIITPWTGSQPIQCHLKMVQSEGSLCIQSTSVRRFHLDVMPTLGGRDGISPSSLLRIKEETAGAIEASDLMALTFNHAVLGGLDSFPRILHPTAESTTTRNNTHPYMVTFYSHQFLSVDGYEKLPKAVRGLAYLFRGKADRDLFREKVFGKKLLASVGIATIQLDRKGQMKPCGTQAMSLWLGTKPDTAQPTDRPPVSELLTVTVQCNSRGKQTEPDCAIEMAVLKARNVDNVRNKVGKELELEVRPLIDKTEDDETTMAGGVLSSDASVLSSSSERSYSIGSNKSSTFFKRRTSSVTSVTTLKPVPSFHCFIKFTESSDDYIHAKRRFVDALKANLSK